MPRKPKYTIVTAMKNEGPYILEWVAHHMAIGFEHIVVVTNDCDDGTTRILDRLAEMGHVTHLPNPKSLFPQRGNWQVMALRYTRLLNIVLDSEWVFHCDVDEFVQIKTRKKSLDGLLERAGPTDVLSFTSMPFNSGGRRELLPDPVVTQFTGCTKSYEGVPIDGPPITNAIKTLYRNSVDFKMRRNHRPLKPDFSSTDLVWRDGSGNVMDAEFTDGKEKAINALTSVGLAQLNHYAIRSIEAYLVKLDRGDVANTDRLDRSMNYWNSYNQQGDTDTRWVKPSAACTKLYKSFLKDPELGPLHDRAFEIHKAKVKRILSTGSGQEMARALGYYEAAES